MTLRRAGLWASGQARARRNSPEWFSPGFPSITSSIRRFASRPARNRFLPVATRAPAVFSVISTYFHLRIRGLAPAGGSAIRTGWQRDFEHRSRKIIQNSRNRVAKFQRGRRGQAGVFCCRAACAASRRLAPGHLPPPCRRSGQRPPGLAPAAPAGAA